MGRVCGLLLRLRRGWRMLCGERCERLGVVRGFGLRPRFYGIEDFAVREGYRVRYLEKEIYAD